MSVREDYKDEKIGDPNSGTIGGTPVGERKGLNQEYDKKSTGDITEALGLPNFID